MSFSGGTFSINSSGQPVVTGTVISSTAFNALTADLATGLSTCILKDGTQTLTANIPMGGFKLTGLAAGSSNGDSLRYEQLIGAYLPIGGGTLTGNLLFTDATYDIGASGATRPRDLFLSRNAVIGGTISVTGHATLEGVTSTGATGTGKIVFDTAPVLGSGTTGTTQSVGDNSTKLATTAYADRAGSGTLGTEQASTSGTSVLFTGIPSTAKKITMTFLGVSTNGTSPLLVRAGPSGGVMTSGYVSYTMRDGGAGGSTAGFIMTDASNASSAYYGTIVLTLTNATNNTWTSSGSLAENGTQNSCWAFAGGLTSSGTVDRISITTANGTDAFDAGAVNIQYQ